MELNDLTAFISVARAGGFRDAARASGVSASSLSIAVRRLETRLGLRLLNRTTRSVAPTEAGLRLLEKLTPLFSEMEAALDVLNVFRDRPSGTLKLNVPASAARMGLPGVIAPFLKAYPDIRVEVVVEDGFVDVLSIGCDAGIRYDERLEQDMIAVPIGPRVQRFAVAAARVYLAAHGRPKHPKDLLTHACIRHRFPSGVTPPWEFERDGEIARITPSGPLIANTLELKLSAAVAGLGIVHSFEEHLAASIARGELEPLLEDWWQSFSGPFLYYAGRRHLPAPLRAFIDFVKAQPR
jgi:DNA-binding transcriptional LysR family regulator